MGRELIFALLLVSPACGPGDADRKDPVAEVLYVTASSLYVRVQPAATAEPVNLLPYGTRVSARPIRTPDQSESPEWYHVEAAGGYVSAEYLQDDLPPAGDKSYELRRLDQDGCSYSGTTTLVLHHGTVQWKHHGLDEGGIVTDDDIVATYEPRPGGLRLFDGNGHRRIRMYDESTVPELDIPRKEALRELSLTLVYVHRFGAFLSPEQAVRYIDADVRFDRESCGISVESFCELCNCKSTRVDAFFCAVAR